MTQEIAAIGIDAGSTSCKVVAVNADKQMTAWQLEPAKFDIRKQVQALLTALSVPERVPTVATGYGRKLAGYPQQVTEITCHARGVFEDLKKPGTLVDIGGQDSKVILIGPQGKSVDFVMNDKCAAGTGRFLEHTAARLDVAIEDMGRQALAAPRSEHISSTCTVFAESEIISLIANGVALDVILAGLHYALVDRIATMINQVGFHPPLMLSGGVSRNQAIQRFLGQAFATEVVLPRYPQLMGAYGAALIALERN